MILCILKLVINYCVITGSWTVTSPLIKQDPGTELVYKYIHERMAALLSWYIKKVLKI